MEIAHTGFFHQVAVGGKEEANVHLPFVFVSNPPIGLGFEYPQERRLHLDGQFADFIQKESALMSQGDEPIMGFVRTRKSALAVTEKFAAHQLFLQGATVLDDQRLLSSLAPQVNGTGHDILARPTFTGDQDRDIGRRHFFNEIMDLLDTRRATNKLRCREAGLGMTQQAILPLQADALIGFFNHQLHPVQAEGFGDVVIGTQFHRLDGVIDIAKARDQDDFHIGNRLFESFQQFNAVPVRQTDIQQDDLKLVLFEAFEGLPGTVGRADAAPHAAELLFEQSTDRFLVINNQYPNRIEYHHHASPEAISPRTWTPCRGDFQHGFHLHAC